MKKTIVILAIFLALGAELVYISMPKPTYSLVNIGGVLCKATVLKNGATLYERVK